MSEETINSLTINYLTEEQYTTAKENNELDENQLYCTPDDDPTGYSVMNLVSEDSSNPICLYDLEEGIYAIYGYIKYYPTYSGTSAISSPTLMTVSKSSTTTYVQFLEPYGNKVTGYEITETSYKEITNVYEYGLTNHSNVSANAWNRCCDDITTDILPAGKYLILTSFSVRGGNTSNNIASLKIQVDGTDLPNGQMKTIPIYNGWASTFNFNGYVEFTSSSTHAVSLRVYTSIALTPEYANKIRFIKIA